MLNHIKGNYIYIYISPIKNTIMKKLIKNELKEIKAGDNICPQKQIYCNGRCIIPEHLIEQEHCN